MNNYVGCEDEDAEKTVMIKSEYNDGNDDDYSGDGRRGAR